MHHFYVEHLICSTDENVYLSQEESAHAIRVLRLKTGTEVRLLDGKNLYAAQLVQMEESQVVAKITNCLPSPELSVKTVLVQGLPKADKLDTIVQKATELGVYELWPVQMERSVSRADKAERQQKKRDRLQRIALEAAKQSGRAHVPLVEKVRTLSHVLPLLQCEENGFDAIFILWEEEHSLRLGQAVRAAANNSFHRIAMVIGPEGGISMKECDALKACGARCCTLGPRILRTETAGPVALAVLQAALEEM